MASTPTCVYLTDTGGAMAAMIAAHRDAQRQLRGASATGADTTATLIARTTAQLATAEQRDEFAQQMQRADIVLLDLHSGPETCPGWDGWTPATILHVQAPPGSQSAKKTAQAVSTTSADIWQHCQDLVSAGTTPNYTAAWKTLFDEHYGLPHAPTPVAVVPAHGQYHHSSALSQSPAAGSVGVWFPRMDLVRGNVDHVDTLVKELTAAGLGVTAVYGEKFPDEGPQADDVLRDYFSHETGTPVDVLLSLHPLSLSLRDQDVATIYDDLNIPVIQTYVTNQTEPEWRERASGLTTREISTLCAQPEFDGLLAGHVVATKSDTVDQSTGARLANWVPHRSGITAAVTQVTNWIALVKTPPAERRLAITFHHHPPRMDQIGCATGLDTFASAANLLQELSDQGYDVGVQSSDSVKLPNAAELAEALVATVAAQHQWLPGDQLIERAHHVSSARDIADYVDTLPQAVQQHVKTSWGEAPGEIFAHDHNVAISGLRYGNVFISLGPPRGILEKLKNSDVHDPTIAPPHHYLEHYRWLREDFGAHAIINLGTHGTVEWLPGKATALSPECFPQIVQGDLPNIYPYIVNNPGEATSAKRRTGATLIGHLPAPTRDAGLTTDVAVIEQAVADFHDAVTHSSGAQRAVAETLWNVVETAGLDADFGLSKEAALADVQHFVEHVHHGLLDLADNQINDGLHVLGRVDKDRLPAYLAQLLKQPSDVPSLRDEILRLHGHNPADVADQWNHEATQAANDAAIDYCRNVIDGRDQKLTSPVLSRITSYVQEVLLPHIRQTEQELTQILAALDGAYIPPGTSGAPQRGNHEVLPTGRNFYSLDPRTLPTPSAWETGVALAEAMLDKYRRVQSHAAKHAAPQTAPTEAAADRQSTSTPAHEPTKPDWPRTIGLTLWGTATMRSRGEDVAQILHLMGLKPRWTEAGIVDGLDIVPLPELGRPRIDVTLRISGFFRDAFGHLLELLDHAVELVASLQEPLEHNLLRAHVTLDAARYAASGVDQDLAWTQASWRVFGPPLNAYGSGVADLVLAQQDPQQSDVTNTFLDNSQVAYTANGPHNARQQLETVLSRVDVTTRTTDTRDYDLLSSYDAYAEQGAMAAAVKHHSGTQPLQLSADSSNPRDVKQRTVAADLRVAIRTKILNPVWREGLKKHGFAGAAELARTIDAVSGWAHTTGQVDQNLLTKIAEDVLLDADTNDWVNDVNPAATQAMLAAFNSLCRTGAWQAPPQLQHAFAEAYLACEGDLEEHLDQKQATTERTFL